MFTANDAYLIARLLHAGQKDQAGEPYLRHVVRVADRLRPHGELLVIAGMLHDTVEDTGVTPDELIDDGVPREAVALVLAVSRQPAEHYLRDFIPRVVASGPQAVTLKAADVADNSDPARAKVLLDRNLAAAGDDPKARKKAVAKSEYLAARYAAARQALTAAGAPAFP